MEKYKYILVCLLVVTINSCKTEEIDTYFGGDQIYFKYATPLSSSGKDSLEVLFSSYVNASKTDSLIAIPVQVIGEISNVDREFKVVKVDSLTTAVEGVDYELLETVIPAHSLEGSAKIKLLRTEVLKKKTLVLGLELLPNSNFDTFFDNLPNRELASPLVFRVLFSDVGDRPLSWVLFQTILDNSFGPYSDVKYALIKELCDVDDEYFNFTDGALINERFAISIVMAWSSRINVYLREYKEKNGAPLLDENNVEVTMYYPYE